MDCTGMTFRELACQLELDVLYDPGPFSDRFLRSSARKELRRRGIEVIEEVLSWVEEHQPRILSRAGVLEIAWLKLMHQILWSSDGRERDVLESDLSIPEAYSGISRWLECARARMQPPAA